jgi:hypothetical protein
MEITSDCDVCGGYFSNGIEMDNHMTTHLRVSHLNESAEMVDEISSYSELMRISEKDVIQVLNKTDKALQTICGFADAVDAALHTKINSSSGKIIVVDALNVTCRIRGTTMHDFNDPSLYHSWYECNKRDLCKCTMSDIIRQLALQHVNDTLFIVAKDPNYSPSKRFRWSEEIEKLSTIPNVVMFPMTVDSMAVEAEDFSCYREYQDFVGHHKKLRIREHDDLGVLLLWRILKQKYRGKCELLSYDQYRDEDLMSRSTPTYKFNIVCNKELVFSEDVDPSTINSKNPCLCQKQYCTHQWSMRC